MSGGKFESVTSNIRRLYKLLSVRDVVGKLISGVVSLNPKSDPFSDCKVYFGFKVQRAETQCSKAESNYVFGQEKFN